MTKKAPNVASFSHELNKLMAKHGVYMFGNIKLRTVGSCEIDFDTYKTSLVDYIEYGLITDRSGPFLSCTAKEKPRSVYYGKPINLTIMDKDSLLANGVPSPITGEAFHNRRDWADHLKAHDCVEVGNDYNNAKAPTEMRGDFNCREELGKATYEVAEKYGYR